jgi:predicted ATP-dependent serine protease
MQCLCVHTHAFLTFTSYTCLLILQETASDLAIAVAVVSSFTGVSARRDTAFIGEIGLGVCTILHMLYIYNLHKHFAYSQSHMLVATQ